MAEPTPVPYALRHWHPILAARDLGRRPRDVTLHGLDLVLFRTTRGVAALADTCPHRRARLSDGHVDGDHVVCPYHGFRYAPDGCGASPGTPRMHLSAMRFEAREAWHAIWVRAFDGEDVPLPFAGRPGFRHFGTLVHDIECPLEPLVDNFCEVEHTPTTHALFGYRMDALANLEVVVETTADTVRVVNRGPQKPLPYLIERAFGIDSGDTFVDDWTVRFTPVHIVYDQYWVDPRTDVERGDRLRLGVFFTPIDRDETRLVTIVTTNRPDSLVDAMVKPLLHALVDREVRLDQRRVERLADPRPDLAGTRLGRFDAPLREHRKRIETIYRGRPG